MKINVVPTVLHKALHFLMGEVTKKVMFTLIWQYKELITMATINKYELNVHSKKKQDLSL